MTAAAPAVYAGVTTHSRVEPLRNRFRYATSMWLVDVDAVPRTRFGRIEARDHVGDPAGSLRSNISAVVGADVARALLLTQPRVLGYVFNPLSLWWCYDYADRLLAVVAEVHNTYGGRHAYVLPPTDVTAEAGTVVDATLDKELYVSPFYGVDGSYRIRVTEPGERIGVTVAMRPTPDAAPFVATLTADRQPFSPRTLARATLRTPWAPLRTSLLIRWQGVRLWARRLPVQPRPVPAPEVVTTR